MISELRKTLLLRKNKDAFVKKHFFTTVCPVTTRLIVTPRRFNEGEFILVN